jgi:diaminohydroxyphosphoribosylaminopyrimidine deaminase/5-amino-6-(5-phosphoribosylamino)uracil reductase
LNTLNSTPDARRYLNLAARLALRARGYVEPNPIVGAVLERNGEIIGLGHHKKYGGLHAETEALADCRAKGNDPRGFTLYVTLEPCNHFGKQPPCSKAIIEAGIARVVMARADLNPVSSGGAEALRQAGIQIEFTDASPLATHISDPFIKRITTGLPWVIVKWAQTADGRLVTRDDEPRWISNEFSRRQVHRLRARVDAVVSGIGAVLADDPLLTARHVHVRRVARRVVLDSNLSIPYDSALVASAGKTPTLIFCDAEQLAGTSEARAKSIVLASAHVSVQGIRGRGAHLDLREALGILGTQYQATNVLIEPGPRLLAAVLAENLADELVVYIAPPAPGEVLQFPGYALSRRRQLGGDTEVRYRRSSTP